MKFLSRPRAAAAVIAAACALPTAPASAAGELNLYSYRQPFLIKPLMDAFTAETGTRVNIVYAQKGMLERIKAEGANSPADAVLTVDIGSLNDMVKADVLAETSSETLDKRIPSNLRDPKGRWYALTTRARVLFVSRDRVDPNAQFSYASLADEAYRGRVCSRSGKHVYNVSLIASYIAHHGLSEAETWLRGVKANLNGKPNGNDRAQARAIHAGECDIGIANSYYYGKMVTNDEKPEQKEWAKSIRVVFPNQDSYGTHVNVSGAGVLKGSDNKQAAIALIEFLSSDKAQQIYAEQNFEHPVVPGVKADAITATLGTFKPDELNVTEVARYRAQAAKLVDKVGYDLGPDD